MPSSDHSECFDVLTVVLWLSHGGYSAFSVNLWQNNKWWTIGSTYSWPRNIIRLRGVFRPYLMNLILYEFLFGVSTGCCLTMISILFYFWIKSYYELLVPLNFQQKSYSFLWCVTVWGFWSLFYSVEIFYFGNFLGKLIQELANCSSCLVSKVAHELAGFSSFFRDSCCWWRVLHCYSSIA